MSRRFQTHNGRVRVRAHNGRVRRSMGRGGASGFHPLMLQPYAYYDTAIGQPRDVGYAQLMGTTGDYIYTADRPALDVTGDLEVVIRVSCADWDFATEEQLASKYLTTGNQRSWRIYHSAGSSTPGFVFSNDGTAVNVRSATASLLSVGAVDGTPLWLKVTLDVDNGATGHDVKFWYSLSTSSAEPTSWTQLGATVTTAGVTSIYSGSGVLELGSYSSGATTPLNGKVHRTIVRRGIDGETVADFDSRNCYADGYLNSTKISSTYTPLYGQTTDYIWTADKAALRITGDLDIAVWVALDDWKSGLTQELASKYLAAGTRSWLLRITPTTGVPVFIWSEDGTAVISKAATEAPVFTNGVGYWLRATLDVDNGATGNDLKFWTSSDPATTAIGSVSWTQLGTTVTTAGVTSLWPAVTAELRLGMVTSLPMTGKVSRGVLRSGIGGTVAADYNSANSNVWGVDADGYGNGWIHASPKHRGDWQIAVPKIYDRSANGRAPVISASGSNAPTVLSWRGTSYVYLAAAGAGTNSISCTAPSGTASYSAVPESGAAPTTGAASPGAFAFTTAGKWASISLLNGSAVEVAKYDAALSTRTGHTDSYAVAWTVNRGTAGAKTAVRSLAAGTDYTVWQYDGNDDRAVVPAAAIPPCNSSQPFSVLSVGTAWNTHTDYGRFFSTRSGGGSTKGFDLGFDTLGVDKLWFFSGDGTSQGNAGNLDWTPGVRNVLTVTANGTNVQLYRDNTASSAGTQRADIQSGTDGRIGSTTGSTNHNSFTSRALITAARDFTAAEIAQLVAYLRGGT